MKDYSDYWNVNSKDRILHYGNKMLEITLKGYEAKDVVVDGLEKKILIQSTSDKKKRTIIGAIGDFKQGSVIEYKNQKWLSIEYVLSDNDVYDKGKMQLCDDTLVLEGEPTKIIVGQDPTGRPIEEIVEGAPIEIPCITSTSISINDEPVFDLANGKMIITIPYTTHPKLKLNSNIKMHDGDYKIIGIDYSEVVDENGIIKITSDRILGVS